jgi:capsular exopolysaccharide synthesis family protein
MSDLIRGNNGGQEKNGLSKFEYVPTYSLTPDEQVSSNGLDPKKILSLLNRYKWLVLLFLILGGTGAWFYADTITPIYESTGTMIISAGSSGDDELSRIISQTTGVGTSSTLANEMQVLRSREFSHQIALALMEEDPGNINEFPVLWSEDEKGAVSRATEGAVTNRIRRSLVILRPERDSEVIQISFQSPSPSEAAHVSNTAMEIYVERSTLQNRRAAESTAEFLERERQEIKEKLDRSEQRLREYMDRTGIVRMDEQASGMVTQQTAVEMEIQQVSLELQSVNQAIENHEQQMERLKPGLAEQFSEAIGPRIRNSQEQLARYEGERTLILTRNPGVRDREQTPPRLKFLDEEIERVKEEIRDLSSQLFSEEEEYMGLDSEERAQMVATIQTRLTELRIQQSQYQSRVETLRQRKQEIEQSFDALPQGMMELARLQRDVAINEELYVSVSRQYADMSVLKQSQFGFGRIIDSALTPGTPVSPNRKILLLLGVMLGGVFVAGIITIKEFSDNSVNNMDMLKRSHLPLLTAVPVLDRVPKRKRKSFQNGKGHIPDELVLLRDRSNLASEAIRRLKNNLTYQYGEEPPKTIAITSAEKGDGKSTIVSNLAAAYAEEGYKTLVIDTDFRRPKLHTYFGYDNENGLIDYLTGKIAIRELIRDTDLNKLKLITSGSRTEKPETIVSSKEFKNFMEKMEEVFDVIILDTPPYGIISDSTALLKSADATILVTKYRKTNKGVFLKTIDELERINAKISGVVVNGFDHRKESTGDYGSGYYKAMYESYESYA